MEERWFHHAALVIWPHAKHWEIACANEPETVLKVRRFKHSSIANFPRFCCRSHWFGIEPLIEKDEARTE